jgi:hypothetical protein
MKTMCVIVNFALFVLQSSLNLCDEQIVERIEYQLKNGQRLNENDARKIDEDLKSIGARNGVLSLTREERVMIVSAMKFTTGIIHQ